MDKAQYHAAKAHLVTCMQEGQSWQRAKASAGLQISQSNAYRLWLAVRKHGETALSDGRHGHPSKLRGAARNFLEEQCRQTSHLPSSALQTALRERSIQRLRSQPRFGNGVCNGHPRTAVLT